MNRYPESEAEYAAYEQIGEEYVKPDTRPIHHKKIVYAVSSGEYSDYRVHGIYENKQDAENEAARYNKIGPLDEAFVESFDWYPHTGNPLGMTVE